MGDPDDSTFWPIRVTGEQLGDLEDSTFVSTGVMYSRVLVDYWTATTQSVLICFVV